MHKNTLRSLDLDILLFKGLRKIMVKSYNALLLTRKSYNCKRVSFNETTTAIMFIIARNVCTKCETPGNTTISFKKCSKERKRAKNFDNGYYNGVLWKFISEQSSHERVKF